MILLYSNDIVIYFGGKQGCNSIEHFQKHFNIYILLCLDRKKGLKFFLNKFSLVFFF